MAKCVPGRCTSFARVTANLFDELDPRGCTRETEVPPLGGSDQLSRNVARFMQRTRQAIAPRHARANASRFVENVKAWATTTNRFTGLRGAFICVSKGYTG
jgi:hypothetical protein